MAIKHCWKEWRTPTVVLSVAVTFLVVVVRRLMFPKRQNCSPLFQDKSTARLHMYPWCYAELAMTPLQIWLPHSWKASVLGSLCCCTVTDIAESTPYNLLGKNFRLVQVYRHLLCATSRIWKSRGWVESNKSVLALNNKKKKQIHLNIFNINEWSYMIGGSGMTDTTNEHVSMVMSTDGNVMASCQYCRSWPWAGVAPHTRHQHAQC